jgi:hypothetical protein
MLNAQGSMLKTARQILLGIGHWALSIDESANGSTVASMG